MPAGSMCLPAPAGRPAVSSHLSRPVDASLSSRSAGAWSGPISTRVSVLSHAPSAACECPVAACVARAAPPPLRLCLSGCV